VSIDETRTSPAFGFPGRSHSRTDGRFVAGTVLANRYRIVSLLVGIDRGAAFGSRPRPGFECRARQQARHAVSQALLSTALVGIAYLAALNQDRWRVVSGRSSCAQRTGSEGRTVS
jgi:hypothetical protein